MRNNLEEIINERLENRYEWKNYLRWLITHRRLNNLAKKEFYKDKPFLNFMLSLYFLPLNTIRSIDHLMDFYKYEKICKEIEVLKNFKNEKKL
tara:strand:- start:231 stop:509 length:279 start_codon:yes stop_codon:yes gene_type:complete